MSFEAELLNATGGADDTFDIRASTRRCFHYAFKDQDVRLWDGIGVLIADGHEWIGTVDVNGNNMHKAPTVKDTRDGTSPRYTFSIPYVDRETMEAMRADDDKVKGRSLTCYHVIVKHDEGMRPGTALRFSYRLTMQSANFSDAVEGGPDNLKRVYSPSILARSGEVGRSRTPSGTYTDTSQRERARLAGFASDSFCSFVAANSNRTYTIEGT
ncbi:hypothetical protein [Sulfitobacter sp.]|uniref:hypothetical protein n=1 Tax=Sulfitobacter sp. TaxID=1903071 RepID=UPI00356890DE